MRLIVVCIAFALSLALFTNDSATGQDAPKKKSIERKKKEPGKTDPFSPEIKNLLLQAAGALLERTAKENEKYKPVEMPGLPKGKPVNGLVGPIKGTVLYHTGFKKDGTLSYIGPDKIIHVLQTGQGNLSSVIDPRKVHAVKTPTGVMFRDSVNGGYLYFTDAELKTIEKDHLAKNPPKKNPPPSKSSPPPDEGLSTGEGIFLGVVAIVVGYKMLTSGGSSSSGSTTRTYDPPSIPPPPTDVAKPVQKPAAKKPSDITVRGSLKGAPADTRLKIVVNQFDILTLGISPPEVFGGIDSRGNYSIRCGSAFGHRIDVWAFTNTKNPKKIYSGVANTEVVNVP